MKEFWLSKESCTGCGACSNICPKNAIELIQDSTGFRYPAISSSCIDCNLCENVCDRRVGNATSRKPSVYAAWSKDDEVRFSSTSGGAFTELANYIISHDGVVYGAAFDPDNVIRHIGATSNRELIELKRSKYAQSDIGLVFREIRNQLLEHRKVLFCGTPCQAAGLKAFLGRDYENLYIFDFICRGVNSPKAFRAWLDELEHKKGSRVTKVWFKYKSGGWRKSPRCTRVDYDNEEIDIFDQEANSYMVGYLGPNLYIRPSCGKCEFKGTSRCSDITLADFWGLPTALDDDKGTSLVMVNSEKGRFLFEKARDRLIAYDKPFEEVTKGNVCFGASVSINRRSAQFFEDLDRMSFSEALIKNSDSSFLGKIRKRALGFFRNSLELKE